MLPPPPPLLVCVVDLGLPTDTFVVTGNQAMSSFRLVIFDQTVYQIAYICILLY